MKFVTYRVDVGGFVDGNFVRDLITVDGQMHCPRDDYHHLNWKTLKVFNNDMRGAMEFLVSKMRETGEVGYLPGGYGFASADKMAAKIDRVVDWYKENYERGC